MKIFSRFSILPQALQASLLTRPKAFKRAAPTQPLRLDDQLNLPLKDLKMGPPLSLMAEGDSLYQVQLEKVKHVSPALNALPNFDITPFKVAVAPAQISAQLQLDEGSLWLDSPQGKTHLGDFRNQELVINMSPQGMLLTINERTLGPFQGTLSIDSNNDISKVNGRAYRGDMELIVNPANPKTFHVLNNVLLEDYLKSVVPSESPASWPEESLKAQAMAARTYAVSNWQKRSAQGYDLNADTSDQMYKGISSEHSRTNQAVQSTDGKILAYQGKPITALFFSTSGGHTDSSLEVWGVDLPYIQAVPDFDQASSRYRWSKTKGQSEIQAAVKKLGLNLGEIQNIEVLSKTKHGRVKTLSISGSLGSAEVNGNKFRFAARLYSTLWTVSSEGQGFKFDGGGWGHGLGMSQWGARQMAEDGKGADEIVKHYYTGIEIVSLDE